MSVRATLARLARIGALDKGKGLGWEIGYWLPDCDDPRARQAPVRPDVLYVKVGELAPACNRDCLLRVSRSGWPESLPKATGYVLAWHNTTRYCPTPDVAEELAVQYAKLKAEAQSDGRRVVGLQMDYDCPTISLGRYAAFLNMLHRSVADPISITASLDWFGPGTRIGEVLGAVDEYVPRLSSRMPHGIEPPSTPIDLARWAPRFNAFGRPYRLGIDGTDKPSLPVEATLGLCAGVVLEWPPAPTRPVPLTC